MLKNREHIPFPNLRVISSSSATVPLPDEESTEEVDFTTEIQAAPRRAAPKRKRTIRQEKKLTSSNYQKARQATSIGFHFSDAKIPNEPRLQTDLWPKQPTSLDFKTTKLGEASRRFCTIPTKQVIARVEKSDDLLGSFARAPVFDQPDRLRSRKEPRRRTIYVPSEDTKILTIHPGLGPDVNRYSLRANIVRDGDQPNITGAVPARGVCRKGLTAAPKRGPFQPTLRTLQKSEDPEDVIGTAQGKENVPPNIALIPKDALCEKKITNPRRTSVFNQVSENSSQAPSMKDIVKKPATEYFGHGFVNEVSKKDKPADLPQHPAASAILKNFGNSIVSQRSSVYYGKKQKSTADVSSTRPRTTRSEVKKRYPILREDIKQPQMFEDRWLHDQECSLRQLVNGLFETSVDRPYGQFCCKENRRSLLQLYQSSCVLVYERIKTALSYGALRPPKDSIAETGRLKTDVGLQQQLIALWVENYNLQTLTVAMEVVIGREITPNSTDGDLESRGSFGIDNVQKAKLKTFIKSCLLKNEDASDSDQSSARWCWERTISRSLMVIFLLDKATNELEPFQRNLLVSSSKLKTSDDIIKQLSTLLLPSLGDVRRRIAHLGYGLSYVQLPLFEYEYRIRSIATDLRDGVRLTRLVEILLYFPESHDCANDDTTVVLPSGGVLTIPFRKRSFWALSQYLRFPCFSRASKIHNLSIALSALRNVRGVGHIVQTLRAEDIVDGHREKTVILLWSLVGKIGLGKFVDFVDLRQEIRRLRLRYGTSSHRNEDEIGVHSFEDQVYLLEEWARNIAQRRGIKISNFTTASANGKILGVIVDEYLTYLPHSHSSGHKNVMSTEGLDAKLKRIGCSSSFTSIFEHKDEGQIFDRDFIIAALAFLCSRLLGDSKRGRAAGVIQRAYRQANLRRKTHQRCVLLRLAFECKAICVARCNALHATRVLQRAWRIHCSSRRNSRAIRKTRGDMLAREDNVDIWLL